jgi:steroid 5-alpha reductase family enzyme
MSSRIDSSIFAVPAIAAVGAGLAAAGSDGGYAVGAVPIYAICIALAFGIQWVAFVPAYLNQTEKFYDLTGSLTYLAVMATAVSLSPVRDARSLLLFALVSLWALRLGSFLFRRILADGFDRRFDEIKPSFSKFLTAWTLQGLWVSFSLAAALAAITSATRAEFGAFAWIGAAIWLFGFGIEAIADRQKREFRDDADNAGRYIATGLWAWSRHPNYFGEIVLWSGIALIAVPNLAGWQWLTLVSPVFVYLLLTRISGIPLLERGADERWGGEPAYENYKRTTPVLFPRPPR